MVHDLETAIKAYWAAKSRREEQAAYHEILLFGGIDGYTSHGQIRSWIIRALRRISNWLDK